MTEPATAARRPGMKPWLPLRCEDGMAITVPDDWTDCLGCPDRVAARRIRRSVHAGQPGADPCRRRVPHPGVWRSFTKADLEGECVDWDEGDGTYYGVQGSGARHITVLWCERGPYVLGEQAEAAEAANV